jgi:peptidoglycan/xylan/chitin deacetylase (PgdA/CDA1 family)
MDEAVELIAAGQRIRRDYLVITLDDGYKDNFIYGYPVFRKYDVRPTIYVTAGNVENQTYLWHDRVWDMVFNSKTECINFNFQGIEFRASIKTREQKKETVFKLWKLAKELDEIGKGEFLTCVARSTDTEIGGKCGLMLNWDEVKKLSEIGVDIGGHTLSHPILAKNPQAFIVNEIHGSKKLIESRLNRNINHFSYPNGKYGDYNTFTVHEVSKHYKSAATTIQGINFTGEDVYALKRIYFSNDAGLTYIKVKLLFIKIGETFGLISKTIRKFYHHKDELME